jgi:ferredoxin
MMIETVNNDVYLKLARHLDTLPGGFPPTETGVELKILKRLFSPEEAEMARHLTMRPEGASDIARRLRLDESETAARLKEMSKKGLILRTSKKEGEHYLAAQFVVGIWEYHVNDLDEVLIRDFNAYAPYLFKQLARNKTQQLRVIPVSASISAEMRVMPYEEAESIIKAQSKIVVAPCICRREHTMVGEGCGRLEEACLVFAGGAYYYEENGLGRSISVEEALDVLHKGMEQGLVLQPGNARKPLNICMCCGCCCQVLTNLKRMGAPARVISSNYEAVVDGALCIACGVCGERCPMDAVSVDKTAAVDPERCIGCGVCAAGCDTNAIKLKPKDEEQRREPPRSIVETYITISKERGLM